MSDFTIFFGFYDVSFSPHAYLVLYVVVKARTYRMRTGDRIWEKLLFRMTAYRLMEVLSLARISVRMPDPSLLQDSP